MIAFQAYPSNFTNSTTRGRLRALSVQMFSEKEDALADLSLQGIFCTNGTPWHGTGRKTSSMLKESMTCSLMDARRQTPGELSYELLQASAGSWTIVSIDKAIETI